MGFFRQLLQYRAKLFVYPAAFDPGLCDQYVRDFTGSDHSEELELTTPDNVTLFCWTYYHDTARSMCSNETIKGTAILFHGNATTHLGMRAYVSGFYKTGFDVLAAEYRGYGESTGSPSESGLRIDAQTVLDHLLCDPVRSQRPIIIFGQSIGGAVAIDLTSRNNDKISALIVENTFTSIPDIMRSWGCIGHFSFLCSEKWNSASRMALISPKIPVLLLSAEDDIAINPVHMEKLRDIANKRGTIPSKKNKSPVEDCERGEVRLQLLQNCGHNNALSNRKYWTFVKKFIQDSLQNSSSARSFVDSKF